MVRTTHLRIVGDEVEANESALHIAFASSDLRSVDQHFGTAEGFVIYQVFLDRSEQASVCRFQQAEQDGDHGKLIDRIAAIESCDAVYATAIGSSAVRQLIKMNVQPLRIQSGVKIRTLITSLQQQMKAHPPAWMRRDSDAASSSEDRFDLMVSTRGITWMKRDSQ